MGIVCTIGTFFYQRVLPQKGVQTQGTSV
ncbi:hypothetical protein [Candidatus Arsenophonus triatominarum]|nr:hypothetical protein [Candidatus Arsenophonus triatominarum]